MVNERYSIPSSTWFPPLPAPPPRQLICGPSTTHFCTHGLTRGCYLQAPLLRCLAFFLCSVLSVLLWKVINNVSLVIPHPYNNLKLAFLHHIVAHLAHRVNLVIFVQSLSQCSSCFTLVTSVSTNLDPFFLQTGEVMEMCQYRTVH